MNSTNQVEIMEMQLLEVGQVVRGIELLDHDEPGFWERNGDHDDGDPFREQRYS